MTSQTDDDAPDGSPYAILGYDILQAVMIARDQANIGAVYTRVFGTTEGRAVLLDLMDNSGVMTMRPITMTAMERAQMDGRASLLIEIFNRAGVDNYEHAAVQQVATTLTDHMERAHDRGSSDNGSPARSGSDREFGRADEPDIDDV